MTQELYAAEIGALRGEVNSIINRMNGNENFCAGTTSAIYAFILTNDLSVISLVLSCLAIVVTFLGIRRNLELQKQISRVDSYLAKIELKLAPEGGWVCHYTKEIQDPEWDGFSKTRWFFWAALSIIAVLVLGYVAHTFLGST